MKREDLVQLATEAGMLFVDKLTDDDLKDALLYSGLFVADPSTGVITRVKESNTFEVREHAFNEILFDALVSKLNPYFVKDVRTTKTYSINKVSISLDTKKNLIILKKALLSVVPIRKTATAFSYGYNSLDEANQLIMEALKIGE